VLGLLASACGGPARPPLAPADPLPAVMSASPREVAWRGGLAPLSLAADQQMVAIRSSRSIAGSTPEERAAAYDAYRATSGHDDARARRWFETEEDRHVVELPGFRIDLMPVTNAAYAEFVADGGAPPPSMDEATWRATEFQQRWPDEVVRSVWDGATPPLGREDHPVVLVTWDDAAAYCAWRGRLVASIRRLPSAHEFEKAARGDDGAAYPWGAEFDPTQLNSAVRGTRDTVPVGTYRTSPHGVLDTAGNVFQWTSTPWPPRPPGEAPVGTPTTMTVKGSAWDDWAGLGRGAAWHGRARAARHVIIGFRCAADGDRE